MVIPPDVAPPVLVPSKVLHHLSQIVPKAYYPRSSGRSINRHNPCKAQFLLDWEPKEVLRIMILDLDEWLNSVFFRTSELSCSPIEKTRIIRLIWEIRLKELFQPKSLLEVQSVLSLLAMAVGFIVVLLHLHLLFFLSYLLGLGYLAARHYHEPLIVLLVGGSLEVQFQSLSLKIDGLRIHALVFTCLFLESDVTFDDFIFSEVDFRDDLPFNKFFIFLYKNSLDFSELLEPVFDLLFGGADGEAFDVDPPVQDFVGVGFELIICLVNLEFDVPILDEVSLFE